PQYGLPHRVIARFRAHLDTAPVKSQSRAHWVAGERSPAEILLLLLLLLLFLGGGPSDEFDAAPVSDKFLVVEAWQASPSRTRVRVSVGGRARRDGGSIRIRRATLPIVGRTLTRSRGAARVVDL